jgi:hypothetical protein
MKRYTEITNPNEAYQVNNDPIKVTHNVRKMIRNRTNKEGQTKVLIEICTYTYHSINEYTTSFKRISTNVWINPKNWSKKKEVINTIEPDSDIKNKQVNEVYNSALQFINSKGRQFENQAYSVDFNPDQLEDIFPKEKKKALTDYILDYYNQRKVKDDPYSTYKEFKTLYNRVLNFDNNRNKRTYFESINFVWSDEFELYLNSKYQTGTIEKTYTLLITVLNHYYQRKDELNILLTNKFREKGFKRGKKSKNEANPLSKEQLTALLSHTFDKKHLQLTKDRFIWQCFTGLRYGDAFRIKPEEVKDNYLKFTPSKTQNHNVNVEQPLNNIAIEILEKYDYEISKLKITNQAYNRNLKEMFKELNKANPNLNYDVNFGSYASRDTFITMCFEAGVDWKTILQFVGQSSYTIMDRYIKLFDSYKQKQTDKLNDYVNKQNP